MSYTDRCFSTAWPVNQRSDNPCVPLTRQGNVTSSQRPHILSFKFDFYIYRNLLRRGLNLNTHSSIYNNLNERQIV